mmetsp:Transcript_18578/g.46254  ORF Transcript_18578/g.46254 Transcript_18578/m.46254 type:complete len:500 (-) Transcript_18578:116-1615(-)
MSVSSAKMSDADADDSPLSPGASAATAGIRPSLSLRVGTASQPRSTLLQGEVARVSIVCADEHMVTVWRQRLDDLQLDWDFAELDGGHSAVDASVDVPSELHASSATGWATHGEDSDVVAWVDVPVCVLADALGAELELSVFVSGLPTASAGMRATDTLTHYLRGAQPATGWIAELRAAPLRLSPVRVVLPCRVSVGSALVLGGSLLLQLCVCATNGSALSPVLHEVSIVLLRDGLPARLMQPTLTPTSSASPLSCELPHDLATALELTFSAPVEGVPPAANAADSHEVAVVASDAPPATALVELVWAHPYAPHRRERTRLALPLAPNLDAPCDPAALALAAALARLDGALRIETGLSIPTEVRPGEEFVATLRVQSHAARHLVATLKGPVGGGLSDAPAVLSLTVRAELGTLAPGAHAFCRVRMLALAEGVLELPALLVELRAAADPSERRDGDERGQIHQTAKHNFYECEAERQPSAFLFAVEVPRGCVRVASDLSS